jgi:pimeloyl-ACP methyl ester carboxylesterase
VLLLVGLSAVAVYLLLLGLLWLQQERIVFQPPVVFRAFGSRANAADVRQVAYRAEDGTELFAFVVGSLERADQVLLAFHGNADLARNLIPWARSASSVADIVVVLPELRGYDGLQGRPTYLDAARDARAARRFVVDELHTPDDRIAYFGHSLGSAIATELASENTPTALLLQSPFSSARAMAGRMMLPGLTLFWPIVSRVHYDTAARVHELRAPVFVAHGLRDVIVPVSMGQAVFDAAAVKGQLLLVPDAGHNDVSERAPSAYWSWFRAGLKSR